jgi:hypothetical protein
MVGEGQVTNERSRNRTDCSTRGKQAIITVGISPTLLLGLRFERVDAFVYNNSGQAIALGFTSDEILFPLATGEYKSFDSYLGELYAITGSGTANVTVEEIG